MSCVVEEKVWFEVLPQHTLWWPLHTTRCSAACCFFTSDFFSLFWHVLRLYNVYYHQITGLMKPLCEWKKINKHRPCLGEKQLKISILLSHLEAPWINGCENCQNVLNMNKLVLDLFLDPAVKTQQKKNLRHAFTPSGAASQRKWIFQRLKAALLCALSSVVNDSTNELMSSQASMFIYCSKGTNVTKRF